MRLGINLDKKLITASLIEEQPFKEIWQKKIIVEFKPQNLLYCLETLLLENQIYFQKAKKIGVTISNELLRLESNLEEKIRQYLQRELKNKITINNQFNCFAWSVSNLEFPQNNLVAGVILDSSFGGAVIQKKDSQRFNLSINGNWGHFSSNKDGKSCYCGRKGCLEQYLSSNVAQNYQDSKLTSIQKIYQLSLENNLTAKKFMQDYLKYFGLAIATIINIYDPELIVFTGKTAQIDALYSDGLMEIKKYFRFLNTKLIVSKLGYKSIAYGAALLA